jgi:hypothetical protein
MTKSFLRRLSERKNVLWDFRGMEEITVANGAYDGLEQSDDDESIAELYAESAEYGD